MKATEKAVGNILGGLYDKAPELKYCDRKRKHKYHKGIGKGKQCVYCGYIRR